MPAVVVVHNTPPESLSHSNIFIAHILYRCSDMMTIRVISTAVKMVKIALNISLFPKYAALDPS